MSRLYLKTKNINGKTVIDDCSFTAPIKIAKPFYRDSYTEIMMMIASAGILDGDFYDIEIQAGNNCAVKFTGQSYTKIFRKETIGASQKVKITVGENTKFLYMPCPVIPFADSEFSSVTDISIDSTSKVIICDVLSAGRSGMGENFLFGCYKSRTAVYIENKLVFLDNVRLVPKEIDIGGIGFFENHTHQGMIYIYGYDVCEIPLSETVEVAFSKAYGGYCIRIAGDSGSEIIEYAQEVVKLFSKIN